MNRRFLLLSGAALVGLCLTGCGSAPRQQASMGMMGANSKVLSLAAGDSLGRAVYVNDMILAAGAIERGATFTNVDEGSIQTLGE